MLTKIEIENYRGYSHTFIFDLSQTKQYGFNKELIKNGIVNKALIYGPNGAGKSNLLLAIMELSSVLTDTNKQPVPDSIYFYAGTTSLVARFRFSFLFDGMRVRYEWGKTSWDRIAFEKLFVDDNQVLEYSHADSEHRFCSLPGCENLSSVTLADNQSFVKFLKINTVQDERSPITRLVAFANGMLYFKSLINGNQYLGFKSGIESLAAKIIQENKLSQFEGFLKEQGLDYKLVAIKDALGQPAIGARFGNKIVVFDAIASSGTKTLELLFYWSLEFEKVTMVLIDEFDAYYHSDIAVNLITLLNKIANAQILLTSHNTRIFSNEFSRPDCCFIHDGKCIKPVFTLSEREFRRSDNLERMYREMNFDVNKRNPT